MKFTLQIRTCDDALLGADAYIELIGMVHEVADRLVFRQPRGKVRDARGNVVGEWHLEPEA